MTASPFESLNAKAIEWILAGTAWLTVAEVAAAAGVRVADVHGWISERRVFAIERDSVMLLPQYALGEGGTPLPIVARVTEIFDGTLSGMALAAYFESTSNSLRGARPREVLASEPDRVAAAAQFNVDTIKYP